MKTIFHDNETGVDLQIEGSFKNTKARTIDKDGNILMEFEGTYSELLKVVDEWSEPGDKTKEDDSFYEEYYYAGHEHVHEEKETINASDFKGATVQVQEDIKGIYDGILREGIITSDIQIVENGRSLIEGVYVNPEEFKKLNILTNDGLYIVNNTEMSYYHCFDKGDIIKFSHKQSSRYSLMFENSEGKLQSLNYEDVTKIDNQEGMLRKFDFCESNGILLTETTDLKGTKVKLNEPSMWIIDDDNLFIEEDESDGVPYVASLESGKGAYISLKHLETSKEEDSVEDIEFEVGDIVKVKQGKENGGAVGYAKITHFKCYDNLVELEGTDNDGIFSDGYVNAIRNLEKIK